METIEIGTEAKIVIMTFGSSSRRNRSYGNQYRHEIQAKLLEIVEKGETYYRARFELLEDGAAFKKGHNITVSNNEILSK